MGAREFTIILKPDPERGGFTVLVPALPGYITEGDSREEAISDAKDAITLHLESLIADGEDIPVDIPNSEVLKVAV